MKKSGIVLFCSLVLLIGQMACKNKSKNSTGSLQADIVADTSSEPLKETMVIDEKSLFASLVDKIPITSLPFGVEGLDTIMFFTPPSIDFYNNVWRDTLNIYGFNRFFQENEQIAVKHISDREGFPFPLNDILPINVNSDSFYFSKRFPPKSGNEYLLFNKPSKRERRGSISQSDEWYLVICNQNGSILEYPVSTIGEVFVHMGNVVSQDWMKVFYIDENYKITCKTFENPQRMEIKANEGKGGISLVDEANEIDTVDCSVMRHWNGKTYVWVSNRPVIIDSESYSWTMESQLRDGEQDRLIGIYQNTRDKTYN